MNILSEIFGLLKEILYTIGRFCAGLIGRAFEWFMAQSFLDKMIIGNIGIAFLAVVLPLVKYWMWESWIGVNNPIGVYLIFISGIMFITIIFRGRYVTALRILVNAWYLLAFLVKWWNHSFCATSYLLTWGFFFNILAPVIFIALSLLVRASE
ncbi:MAG TPA: hypothetical protein PK514_01070 [Spirochaetota bacterium]|nr:hypothetical protein [Spirochaetota bacterium]